jgi:hypothetical protein
MHFDLSMIALAILTVALVAMLAHSLYAIAIKDHRPGDPKPLGPRVSPVTTRPMPRWKLTIRKNGKHSLRIQVTCRIPHTKHRWHLPMSTP